MLTAQCALIAGMDAVVEANCWALSDAEVGAALDNFAAMQARITAGMLALIGEVDGRRLGVQGATTTAGWLRGRLRVHPGDAHRLVALAGAAVAHG